MKLLVTTTDDLFVQVEVHEDMPLRDLRALLETETRIPAGQQQLQFRGTMLVDDTKTLKDYNIANDDALVMLRLPMQPAAAFRAPTAPSEPAPEASDEDLIRYLESANPQLAHQAKQSPEIKKELLARFRQNQRDMRILQTDPTSPEAQEIIAKMIRQQNIEQSYHSAMENNPEFFGQVPMLYIRCEINKFEAKAFIDTGAQSSIMSAKFADASNLMHLVDERFVGVAKGVGETKIIGRIHGTELVVAGGQIMCSFNVLSELDVDMIIGLDILRRHQATIDLARDVLVISGIEAPFLKEHEINKLSSASLAKASAAASSTAAVRAAAASPSQGTSTGGRGPSNSTGPSTQFSENAIQTLMGFGITREQAIKTLQAAGGNVDLAASLIFDM
ncbi:DNA damage-inducible protein 1 [Dimargaris verticillata]|uniref:DNA damage-inducible protein 1 n=1 Tax=Dimargaris verticillata TaxID=2761393 RepID=A0A9W8B4G1_9FUNG|nr:DNA damage-inducible protein 1 [Dimargaris verticillata]